MIQSMIPQISIYSLALSREKITIAGDDGGCKRGYKSCLLDSGKQIRSLDEVFRCEKEVCATEEGEARVFKAYQSILECVYKAHL